MLEAIQQATLITDNESNTNSARIPSVHSSELSKYYRGMNPETEQAEDIKTVEEKVD